MLVVVEAAVVLVVDVVVIAVVVVGVSLTVVVVDLMVDVVAGIVVEVVVAVVVLVEGGATTVEVVVAGIEGGEAISTLASSAKVLVVVEVVLVETYWSGAESICSASQSIR